MVDPIRGKSFAGLQIPNYAGTQFQKEIEGPFRSLARLKMMLTVSRRSATGHAKGSNNAVCLTLGQGSAVASCSMVRSFLALIQPVSWLSSFARWCLSGSSFNDGFGQYGQNITVTYGTVEWPPDL